MFESGLNVSSCGVKVLSDVVVRFTDVTDVVQAIRTHPDAEVAKCLKIGAVTCCVDPLNTFMENRCEILRLT